MLPGMVTCLFSHKCRCRHNTHEIYEGIRPVFRQKGVTLLRDPFRKGDVIDRRIETLGFETLLFVACAESLASAPCDYEREVARRRLVPAFCLRLEGDLPSDLKRRLYVDLEGVNTVDWQQSAAPLAALICSSGRLYRTIEDLDPGNLPEVTRETAKQIATKTPRKLLAEFVENLTRHYQPRADPIARFWIAEALGRAGTREAVACLRKLLSEEGEPYPLHSIRQALEKLNDDNETYLDKEHFRRGGGGENVH